MGDKPLVALAKAEQLFAGEIKQPPTDEPGERLVAVNIAKNRHHLIALTVVPLHFVGDTGLEGTLVWRPLPLQLPTVHVDALWHVRRAGGAAQRWLRDVVARAAAAEHLPQQSPTAV